MAPARRGSGFAWIAGVGAAILAALLALPFVALFARISPADLLRRMGEPALLDALKLSLVTSLLATFAVVLLGTPAAWLLATRRFRGKRFVEVLVELPMVLPPTVAGFALLMAFGRMGLAGHALRMLGFSLPFTTAGVVVAQAFMAAPFYVAPARAAFASVDPRMLEVASTLRASERFAFFHVVVPLARNGLLTGATLACARALGEFGATITFAGNLPGVTQTLPLAVYVALQSDLDVAIALSSVLVVASLALLLAMRAATGAPLPGLFRARD